MLLRFTFKNHGSFRDSTEVSFVATRLKDNDVHAPIPAKILKYGVLPAVALYGGNASGKSTVMGALKTMSDLIDNSYNSWALVPQTPFRLDDTSQDAPTQFDCDFLIDDVRYEYGFVITKKLVVEEWLCAYPRSRRQIWFHIKRNGPKVSTYFGPAFKGNRKCLAAAATMSSLFLHALPTDDRAIEQLSAVRKFLRGRFKFYHPPDMRKPMAFLRSPLLDPERKDEVLRLLRAADFGVKDFQIHNNDNQIFSYKQIVLQHEGGDHWLDPSEESSGTIALIHLLDLILTTLNRGALLVVELPHNLHPLLCAELIKMFTNPRSNPKGAQILFSASSASHMDDLRRDEVLLVDKHTDGSSHIVPMSDFKIRHRKDMAILYREGRVGGLPRTGCLSRMMVPPTI